jgi:hypothetical protein
MKHILTTNEPFLLERGEESVDLMNLKILDWTELPWWLNGTNNSAEIDEEINSLPYIPLEGFYGGDSAGDLYKLRMVYGVYLTGEYETGYTETYASPYTSELNKIFKKYYEDRSYWINTNNWWNANIGFLIWDFAHGKAYRARVRNINGTPTIEILLAVEHQYDPNRIYSYPMEFGTKIYFKFKSIAVEKFPSTSLEDMDPTAWVYRLNLIPIYHDTIVYNESLVKEPYMSSTLSEQDNASAYTACFYYYSQPGSAKGKCKLTPCVYHEHGTVDSLYIRSSDYFHYFFNSYVDLIKPFPVIGRFVAGADSIPINSGDYIEVFPDSNPSIIEGHTYEYSILDGVFNLIDITQTI